MNWMMLTLLMVLAINDPTYAHPPEKKKSGFEKVLRSMFTPRTRVASKPKAKSKPKQRSVKCQEKTVRPNKTVVVDSEWMARYWELETAWDYPIPEDELIKWENGKYIVPFMVLQHYEDMDKTPPRRIARPQSDAGGTTSQAFSLSSFN